MALETYRRDGTPVSTPVGFVEDGDTLLIRTAAHSGKVKRIRHNDKVRLAPSNGRGKPTGAWVEATATLLAPPWPAQVRQKLLGKYGLTWRIVEAVATLRDRLKGHSGEWTAIRISL